MLPDKTEAERTRGELSRFSCRSVPMPGCVHVVPQGELDVGSIPLLDRSLRLAG